MNCVVAPQENDRQDCREQIGGVICHQTQEQGGHAQVSRDTAAIQSGDKKGHTAHTATGHRLIGEQFGDADGYQRND